MMKHVNSFKLEFRQMKTLTSIKNKLLFEKFSKFCFTQTNPIYEHDNMKRVQPIENISDPVRGRLFWEPKKSIFMMGMNAGALLGLYFISLDSLILFSGSTLFTLCFGHSLGMHRKLIHNSFDCPKWLEYTLVYIGTLVGMSGPYGMVKTHDMRDWAQRQPACHDYYAHKDLCVLDSIKQIHCDIQLDSPPKFIFEDRLANDKFYQFLEKTWRWQQLPWALLFYYMGGIPYVLWGVCARVSVSVFGHWRVGFYAHNRGEKHYHVEGACVQGHNIKGTMNLFTYVSFGESLHNNHHAFPGSANFAVEKGEVDLGYKVLKFFEKMGLVWNIREAKDLPPRKELKKL